MYMTPLSGIKPQWVDAEGVYALPFTHLPLAINAIEAKLGQCLMSTAVTLIFSVLL